MIPSNSPIPAGKYWIVDRVTGGFGSRAWASIKDTVNSAIGSPVGHAWLHYSAEPRRLPAYPLGAAGNREDCGR
nr:hypothetical protein [Paraburkholderia heleia]